jgi:hypothetical protein
MAHRSHLTQELLNYFDETDVRTREIPWTIEAQLLNAAACAIEESDLRISREIRSTQLGRAPLNLDNRGVWRRIQIPFRAQDGDGCRPLGLFSTDLHSIPPN